MANQRTAPAGCPQKTAFVTHDLAVVRSIADRICVMRDGMILETAATETLFTTPSDAYAGELLAAVPRTRTAAR